MKSHVETASHLAVRLFVVIIAASADLAGKAGNSNVAKRSTSSPSVQHSVDGVNFTLRWRRLRFSVVIWPSAPSGKIFFHVPGSRHVTGNAKIKVLSHSVRE